MKRAVVTVVAVVALAACTPATESTTTTITVASTTTTTAPTTTTTTAPVPFDYRVGLTSSPTTDNFWGYYDPQSSLVDSYILGPTKPSLYVYDAPGLEITNDLAADPAPPTPVQDGDTWTVTVTLREAVWSDDVPITSDDIVFTFETVKSLGLQRGWASAYPLAEGNRVGLVGVEAPDPQTVVFRFNARPGLAFFPNGPGTAPIMPRHFWEASARDAITAGDPDILTGSSGSGDPSGGPFTVVSYSPDVVKGEPNLHYQRTGERVTSGGVGYEIGPYFDSIEFRVFTNQSSAAQALSDGDIDVILTAAGLERRVAKFLREDANVAVIDNQTNGFRYLAFNLRKAPMSVKGFRDALAVMIDREFVAGEVLQDAAIPLYATVPPANPNWFDRGKADALAAFTRGLSAEQRLNQAVVLLKDAGFAWDRPPAFVNNGVTPGVGVTYEGNPVAALNILSPNAALDPLRATYALWITEWLRQLGFQVDLELTDLDTLVRRIFSPTADGALDFDMYVLGWRFPSPMPLYHESLFGSRNDTLTSNGNNNTGFHDAAFDALVEQFLSATTENEARDILWQMEQELFDQKPYIVLFDAPLTEAYRYDTVAFPFTNTIAGLQFLDGMPGVVMPVR
jgi:ABC-type transport system substrate-binding protein